MTRIVLFVLAAAVLLALFIYWRLTIPSRHYTGIESVSAYYEEWSQDRFLEYYWGGHLHAGYYKNPPTHKNFIPAKIDMIDEMVRWGIAGPVPEIYDRLEGRSREPSADQVKILDVGCGLGGSASHMALRWADTAHITGITISRAQARRAAQLARARGINNADFLDGNALYQPFPAESFDIVWALESEPHIADKERFFEEMTRLLKPGGILVVGTWNVRNTRLEPLSKADKSDLQYLLDEWCHARFASMEETSGFIKQQGLIEVVSDDWSGATMPTWRESVLEVIRDPRGVAQSDLTLLWSRFRSAYTLLRFDGAFRKGLCHYGMFYGRKMSSKQAAAST
jgi:MPBQ/MSBQ methyltransferase